MSTETIVIPNKLERATLERALQILQKYDVPQAKDLDFYLWKVCHKIEADEKIKQGETN